MLATLADRSPMMVLGRFLDRVPVDLEGAAAAMGAQIYHVDLGNAVSGMIQRDKGGFRITLNSAEAPQRQRFTLAHELAHLVLHRDMIGDGVVDSVLYRSTLSDEIERQANRFAADILMPANLVRDHWKRSDRSFTTMANYFGVSADAARIRMKDLRLAP